MSLEITPVVPKKCEFTLKIIEIGAFTFMKKKIRIFKCEGNARKRGVK